MPRRVAAIVLFMIGVAGFAVAVWWYAFTAALAPLAERGRADLSLASDRLVGELSRFRQVAALLSDHPALTGLTGPDADYVAAQELLLSTVDKTGTLNILFADQTGAIKARALGAAQLDDNPADTPHFRRAMHGAMGSFHASISDTGQRIFYFAAPVFGAANGKPLGAVIVSVDMEAVEESDWRGNPESVFFTDERGIVFVANRSELLFRQRSAVRTVPDTLPFYDFTARTVAGHEIWAIDAGAYIPQRALHLSHPLPVIGMQGELLISTASAEQSALQQALVAAALCLAFGAMLFLATERRRGLALRLEVEARANAALEQRVEARTQELSGVNADLRHEIAERQDAELALKKAQADLVQAGKLSALGEMSAGLSHELNQPLMAIRSFAENAETFLERGKPETAAQNLGRISELARRMGRIIKNLRSFAKQENEPMSNVDILAVIEAVLEMSESRLKRADVTVVWHPPVQPIFARGGEVRLQQVLVNLLSNAVDAMEDHPEKTITLDVRKEGAKVLISLRDTGPGIAQIDKIFDPFYSTKDVGAAKGMGLGLSISYGLVQSFGGNIRGRNHPDGGAEFTVELAAGPTPETLLAHNYEHVT